MTKQEFDKTPINAGTVVIVSGQEYELFSVDYELGMIELVGGYVLHYKFCEYKLTGNIVIAVFGFGIMGCLYAIDEHLKEIRDLLTKQGKQ